MKLKIKKLVKEAQVPKKTSELAGGMDVVATEIVQKEDDLVICKLGFSIQPPANCKLTLVPRSSLTKTKWIIQNSPCLLDPDYTGEYQIRFRALPDGIVKLGMNKVELTYPDFPYEVGDRVAQLYLEEIIPAEFEIVNELDETPRGDGGFGSTGKIFKEENVIKAPPVMQKEGLVKNEKENIEIPVSDKKETSKKEKNK
jgi:dUTP pyrophosphatase